MAKLVKGDVVVVPFPFSDLSKSKRRPALVIATLTGSDVILCQITSQNITDSYGIRISNSDFISSSLNQISNIRPNKIFTIDSNIIIYKIGKLKDQKIQEVTLQIIKILQK